MKLPYNQYFFLFFFCKFDFSKIIFFSSHLAAVLFEQRLLTEQIYIYYILIK